jgi:hypothetical protein
MSQFYPVTIEEVRDLLKKENGWNEETGRERQRSSFSNITYGIILTCWLKCTLGLKKIPAKAERSAKTQSECVQLKLKKANLKDLLNPNAFIASKVGVKI